MVSDVLVQGRVPHERNDTCVITESANHEKIGMAILVVVLGAPGLVTSDISPHPLGKENSPSGGPYAFR